jgi:hypothetical protein
VKAKALAAVVIAGAIFLAPATAGAASPRATSGARHHPTVLATMAFHGTNGFLVEITMLNRTKLRLTAYPEAELLSGNGIGVVSTEYSLTAPQPRGSNGIKASLGRFGRIDVRFVPESTEEVEPLFPVCKGEMEHAQAGRFVGLIAFQGERGYTRVRRKGAPGAVLIAPAPTCKSTPPGRKPHVRSSRGRAEEALRATARRAKNPDSHVLLLRAKAQSGNREVAFDAMRLSGPGRKGYELSFDTFVATVSRDRGRIHEESSATEALALGPFFKVPDLRHLTSEAVIRPPRPFSGGATFRRESEDGVSWKGDLRVKLPGFGVVPLTSASTRVSMCADSGCR